MFKFGKIVIVNKLLLTGILCVGYFSFADADYIRRNEWGARLPIKPPQKLSVNPPPYVLIHHSDSNECFTRNSCIAKVKSFQEIYYLMTTSRTWICSNESGSNVTMRRLAFAIITIDIRPRSVNHHMDDNHWDDIGYNFLVGDDGNVYEGRGWGIKGAHSPLYNSKSIGICIIGTFIKKVPGQAAIEATQQLIANGVLNGTITNNYTLLGHRQTRITECPGDELYKLIQTWPQWKNISRE